MFAVKYILCYTENKECNAVIYICYALIPQLKKQTGSSTVFLVPLLRETEEAVVQVIGEKVLQQEMRFPVSSRHGSLLQEYTCLHKYMYEITNA
jgi:hypothetical protein